MKSKIELFNDAVAAMETYLYFNGWIKDETTKLWYKPYQNKFYFQDAFKVQANIDFGN